MAEQTFTIAAIPADGVGKEVVAAGREVLDYLAEHSGWTVLVLLGGVSLGQRVLRQNRRDDGPRRFGDT